MKTEWRRATKKRVDNRWNQGQLAKARWKCTQIPPILPLIILHLIANWTETWQGMGDQEWTSPRTRRSLIHSRSSSVTKRQMMAMEPETEAHWVLHSSKMNLPCKGVETLGLSSNPLMTLIWILKRFANHSTGSMYLSKGNQFSVTATWKALKSEKSPART